MTEKTKLRMKRAMALLPVFTTAAVLCAGVAFGQEGGGGGGGGMAIPRFTIGVDQAQSPKEVALSLQIIFLFTILSLAPSILLLMTSFTRIVIVLSLVRNALGTQQMPPSQVLAGIALFLTFFIMAPVFKEVNETALQPYLNEQLTHVEALKAAEQPMREFMFKQTRRKDLALFINLSRTERPKTKADIPTHVLIPAFVISELKSAFEMGFIIFIPFLVIDMVVASTLMSMGMLMLPPIMISMPFKILIFIMVDGWALIARGLVLSFHF